MLGGLKEVEQELRKRYVPFYLLMGDPVENIPDFVVKNNAALLVTDFSPLRVPLDWTNKVAAKVDKSHIPVVQVDAHNIVPVWFASDHQE